MNSGFGGIFNNIIYSNKNKFDIEKSSFTEFLDETKLLLRKLYSQKLMNVANKRSNLPILNTIIDKYGTSNKFLSGLYKKTIYSCWEYHNTTP